MIGRPASAGIPRPPPPLPPPSSRKPNPQPQGSQPSIPEPDDDATSLMNRARIDGLMRQQQAPRTARPAVDLVPGDQRTGNERTATALLPQNAPNRPPPPVPRSPSTSGGFSRAPAPTGQGYSRVPAPAPSYSRAPVPPPEQRVPSERPPERGLPESVGAIALPRPPVQQPVGIISRAPAPTGQRLQPPQTAPLGAQRTVRHNQANPAPVPALDDLVPQRRSDRPGFGRAPSVRPPASHRSNPPRERPRFADRTPEPRPPGFGLPQPDSLGRLPAPRYDAPDYAASAVPNAPPEETMAMRHNPYAGSQSPGEYYPPPQPQRPPSTFPSHFQSAPPPPAATVRDQEYYPHLQGQPMQQQMQYPTTQPLPHIPHPSQHPSAYPPAMNPMHPMHMHPGAMQQGRTMPPSAPVAVRVPTPIPPAPGAFPGMAPQLEAPSFFGLVLFAAPLAIGTLAVAALALL